jgi:hypothetical protein
MSRLDVAEKLTGWMSHAARESILHAGGAAPGKVHRAGVIYSQRPC